jgi:2-alkyl-3-oxoalkanoate reductase
MKIFVAGATGVLGRRLVPALTNAGHDVVGMTRTQRGAETVRALGATAVVGDGLDRDGVMRAVVESAPEVVVHQMTALPSGPNIRRFDDTFAATNRLRTEGTRNLLDAAAAAGARRFVAQSYAGWPYQRSGHGLKTEEDPLDPSPPARMSRTLAAIRQLESMVTGQDQVVGVVLRYGSFYGPGSDFSKEGSMVAQVRKRRLPVIGDGAGVFSFVHLDDAAGATVLAVDHGHAGIYNVVDDEPAPASIWLPELARMIGAKPPRRVPVWVGRLAAGEPGVSMFTRVRGASNAKAKRELGWTLTYPSWRQGFRDGL